MRLMPSGRRPRLLTLAPLLLLAACAQADGGRQLTLATWNAEWLMEPATFDNLAPTCLKRGDRAGGEDRRIPCDLAPDHRWSDADLARLRDFASRVPADVFALQEVDGASAAARLFPDREFCFTRRRQVQNVGFAIRRGIPYRCNPDYRALGLPANDVRWGADLTLYPGTPQELRLLAVHLKSGCNHDALTSGNHSCEELQRQVPILEAWIAARASASESFVLMGDFNRRFDQEPARARDGQGRIIALWPEIHDGRHTGSRLLNPDDGRPTAACRQQDPVRPAIDHILLGASLEPALVAGSYRMWPYPRTAGEDRWPDHCIRSVTLDLARAGH